MATFRHFYPGTDPDECSVAEFYALIGAIPPQLREVWGAAETMESRVEREAIIEAIIAGPLNPPT